MSHAATDPTSILDRVAKSPWARTLWQGFIVDALAAIGLALTVLLGTVDPTSPAFWSLAVGIVVKSFVTAFVSFLTRLKTTPVEGGKP